jgi:hypothetical protein
LRHFADERCGGFGIVYQACSFGYYGEHFLGLNPSNFASLGFNHLRFFILK